LMLLMFRTLITGNSELSDEKICELVDVLMNAISSTLRSQLQAA